MDRSVTAKDNAMHPFRLFAHVNPKGLAASRGSNSVRLVRTQMSELLFGLWEGMR
jgi:hypothetical protein